MFFSFFDNWYHYSILLMPNPQPSIFRKESLERLSSPERLDQLMQVVKPRDWLALGTLGLLIVLALIWSFLGRIPVTVSGRGVLISAQKLQSREQAITSALVNVSYFTIADGKRIAPGMKAMVTPDTVKREQFGSIYGTVSSVSSFPITTQSAAQLIGNEELASSLIRQTGKMQVVAQLKLDPSTFSGYRWTSSQGSPHQQLSPGITTSVRVVLAQKAPISFILPILQSEKDS